MNLEGGVAPEPPKIDGVSLLEGVELFPMPKTGGFEGTEVLVDPISSPNTDVGKGDIS
jgi:hypothetical protein